MTDYPTPELEGQTSLLDLAPRPRPHTGVRLQVLEALETATEPVDAHWIACRVDNFPNVTSKRLQELEEDGLAYRAGRYDGPKGQPRTLWRAA